jgi:GNAT superfamily N-acetyltransferase
VGTSFRPTGYVATGKPDAIGLHNRQSHVLTEFEALEANLRQSFRILAQGRPRADITELDGVSIASLGASFQMFNAAFLNRPAPAREDLEDRLAGARSLFASRGLPWAFWIGENWLGRSARRALVGACESFGMRAAAEMPAMVADSLREPKRSLPSAGRVPLLDIRRADAHRAMEDFRSVGSVCFHVPPAWFSEVFDDSIPSRDFTCWVGYRGARPVATAATVVSDGVIGLYNVATMPDDRGKGYAEAVTRHAVAGASRQSGLTRIILQSTAQGERLYKRLGFREVSRVVVFNSNGSRGAAR